MSQIDLEQFDNNGLYDADDVAAITNTHRTTVHRQVFARVPTIRVGRKDRATGYNLKKYFRGELGGDGEA